MAGIHKKWYACSKYQVMKGADEMATIQPKGESIRQAVKWISAERLEDEKKALSKLIREAALRFNLSPKDEEYLCSFYAEKGGKGA
ncbi:MAG: hypothetical protein ABIL06_19465 [Pseudomonadota bacterium]